MKQNRFKRDIGAEGMAGVTSEDINWKNEGYYQNGVVYNQTKFESYKQSGLNKLNAYRQKMARAKKQQEDTDLQMLAMNMAASQGDYEAQMRALGIWSNPSAGGGGGRGGRGGRKTPAKETYVPQAGTPDYVKAQISALQGMVGQTENESERNYILMWIESLKAQYKEMTSLPKLSTVLDTSGVVEQHGPLYQMTEQLKELRKILEDPVDAAEYQYALQMIADKEKEIKEWKGESETTEVAKKTSSSWKDAASSIQAVGSALQSIEDPGAKIAGLIGQAIANIALGFAQATAASSGAGIFGWIAAIAGGLATMVSTIEAIHSATGYAEGGVVKGNTYSGDKIPAMLNAGEVVLSKAAAGNLASQFSDVGLNNLSLQAVVTGTQLRFVLNNESQSRGRGQYVTTNFSR